MNVVNVTEQIMYAQSIGFQEAVKFNTWVVYAIYFACVGLVIAGCLWIYFWSDSKKSRFLRFTNESECRIVKGDINNQKFSKKNKSWVVQKAKPVFIKTWFGKRPLYLIRDDCAIPFEFGAHKKIKLSAESLKAFCDHDNIKTIIRLTQSNKGNALLMLGAGGVAGILVGFIIASVI